MANYLYITVLTPTYNRANTLPKLFSSLQRQQYLNFEWLIIDDGSTDDTIEVVSSFIAQADFLVRLIKKENGGKHSALNVGFEEAAGIWILVIDSDDWLLDSALKMLENELIELEDKDDFASLCALRVNEGGKVIGDRFDERRLPRNYIDFLQMNIAGDKADVIKKNILQNFKFPTFSREKFMAESPLFLFIGSNYLTKFSNIEIYFCKYWPDGLSAFSLINRACCTNSTLYVYEYQFCKLPLCFLKIKSGINWWRFYFHGRKNYQGNWYAPCIYLPAGLIANMFDRWNMAQ